MARDDTPATPAGLPYLLIYQYGWQTPQGQPVTHELVASTLVDFACAREDEELERSRPSPEVRQRVLDLVRNLDERGELKLGDWNQQVRLGAIGGHNDGGPNCKTHLILGTGDVHYGYMTPIGLLAGCADRWDHASRLFGLSPPDSDGGGESVRLLAAILYWIGGRGLQQQSLFHLKFLKPPMLPKLNDLLLLL